MGGLYMRNWDYICAPTGLLDVFHFCLRGECDGWTVVYMYVPI